jgi:hypothetical protein
MLERLLGHPENFGQLSKQRIVHGFSAHTLAFNLKHT